MKNPGNTGNITRKPAPSEGVKKFMNEQKHLAQRRRGAKVEKKTKQLSISSLCASASLREIVHFFTPSSALQPQDGLTPGRVREGQTGIPLVRRSRHLCRIAGGKQDSSTGQGMPRGWLPWRNSHHQAIAGALVRAARIP
jgi:hypothetical protein